MLSAEKWHIRRAARSTLQPAKVADALVQDGPLRASMDPQCLRAKTGFTDTVSALAARDIYTICLHTNNIQQFFFSEIIQGSSLQFHLVCTYICLSLTADFY
ncbi:hypothetical protein AMECASPLE_038779 [Ameca splendens]|uniref:Uncharacterized protein n=1 Tax=Ameca splendens TaxID=208324 RepID=A0ABV0Y870_9TELE